MECGTGLVEAGDLDGFAARGDQGGGSAAATVIRLIALLTITAARAAKPNQPISIGSRNSAPPRPVVRRLEPGIELPGTALTATWPGQPTPVPLASAALSG